MKDYLTFILLILSFGAISQTGRDYCVRTTDKKFKDLKNTFPLNQTKTIKVVSFKPLNKEEPTYKLPLIHDEVDMNKLFEIKTLSNKQRNELVDILYNFNNDPQLDTLLLTVSSCYNPRHAILFENKEGKVFAYIEFCIECLGSRIHPQNLQFGDFCYTKYNMLANLFQKAGIRYGIGHNGEPWNEE